MFNQDGLLWLGTSLFFANQAASSGGGALLAPSCDTLVSSPLQTQCHSYLVFPPCEVTKPPTCLLSTVMYDAEPRTAALNMHCKTSAPPRECVLQRRASMREEDTDAMSFRDGI